MNTQVASWFAGLILVLAVGAGAGCSSPAAPADVPPATDLGLPGPVFNVKAYGAKGDGSRLNTVEIQAAIDACAGTGGTVLLEDGVFLCSTLRLKSGMRLYINTDAVLKGSRYYNDYPFLEPPTDNGQLLNCRRALVYAEGVSNVVIEGQGFIDGQNSVYDHGGSKEAYRPMAVFIACSSNVTVRDLRVRHACMWSTVFMEVRGLVIERLDVTSEGITRDGIDLVDCHDAVVRDCAVRTGDDGICLKSGSAMGLKNILVRDCRVESYCNAIKFGTPTHGPIEGIVFRDIAINNTRFAGIAVEAIDGSDERDILFERITMDGVGTPFFVLLGKRGYPAGQPDKVATVDGLRFRDITVNSCASSWGALVSGTVVGGVTNRIKSIEFTRVSVFFRGGAGTVPGNPPEYAGQYPECDMWGNLPAAGYWFRHVDQVRMTDCVTGFAGVDARPAVSMVDVGSFSNAAAWTNGFRRNLPAVYLRGTANAWGKTPLALVGDNHWRISLAYANGGRFKFDDEADWGTYDWGDNNPGGSMDGTVELRGKDIVNTYPTGEITVNFNDATLRYWVTQP